MFTIIGGDNKPYGPSSVEEVREWLVAGRANGSTLAREDNGVWKPLSAFPQFADLTGGPGATPPPLGRNPQSIPTPDEILARGFDVDIGGCLKRSWALMQQNFWPLVGITFLVLIAMGSVNEVVSLFSGTAVQDMFTQHKVSVRGVGMFFLTSVLGSVGQAVFMGGLFRYYLKLIRGEEVTVGDAFYGFTAPLAQLMMAGLAIGSLTMLAPVVAALVIAMMGGDLSATNALVLAASFLPMIYLTIAWFFTVPLVVDRQMDFGSALSLSLRTVNKNWFTMFGLILVVGFIGVIGVCGACIGIFVTLPVSYLMLMYAYEDIFGPRAG